LKGYRGQMMARKIQARLGGDRSGFEFPDKPKGMHCRTYERWREKHEAAVAKSWSAFRWSRFARGSASVSLYYASMVSRVAVASPDPVSTRRSQQGATTMRWMIIGFSA
jgi:hypothetical protein